MAIDIQINPDAKLLCVRAESNLYTPDIEQYYSRLQATEGIQYCNKAFIDMSDPSVSVKHVTIKSVAALGKMFRLAPLLPDGTKMAFVVNNTLVYGFVRLFMGNRGEGVEIRPFKRSEKALKWLGLSKSALIVSR